MKYRREKGGGGGGRGGGGRAGPAAIKGSCPAAYHHYVAFQASTSLFPGASVALSHAPG